VAQVVWTAEAERWSPSGREVRILIWGHYRIVYLVRSNDDVHIVGVFHGAMRFQDYLE